jgi:hypothetical protein
MASVFVTLGVFMAFALVKDPSPAMAVMLARFPPGGAVMAVVVLAYPVWGAVGIILGLLFLALQNGVPGGGLGSPNVAYSIAVTAATFLLAVPVILLLRRVWQGVVGMALSSVAIFGWLLPLLAS